MKIFNLPRGRGKSMRMLYASEFNDAPILCYNEASKKHLLDMAKWCDIVIPEPVTVNEFANYKGRAKRILIDEMDATLSLLLLQAFGTEIIGGTITTEKET